MYPYQRSKTTDLQQNHTKMTMFIAFVELSDHISRFSQHPSSQHTQHTRINALTNAIPYDILNMSIESILHDFAGTVTGYPSTD